MNRFAQFGSGASLHRDDADSQSLSQARPRPAIRLDASLSFLNANSRVGSPRSEPASPALAGLTTNIFAVKDVNVEAAAKSQRQHRRAASGSLQATSISLSLGSSRPRSQHSHAQHPLRLRGAHSSAAPSKSLSCRTAGSPSPVAAMDAVLDSEATCMTRPSEPRAFDGEEASQGLPRERRTTSPAPRMAVTLPDDFDGVFSESRSVAAPVPAEEGAELRAVPRRVADEQTTTHDKDNDFSALSSFSLGFKDSDARGEVEEEMVTGRSTGSRTWSTTPPPRRAFVLSRRCSAASAVNNADDDEEAEATVKEVDDAPPSAEEARSEVAQDGAPHTAHEGDLPLFPRVSEMLVTRGDSTADSFFRQACAGERERRCRQLRRSDKARVDAEEDCAASLQSHELIESFSPLLAEAPTPVPIEEEEEEAQKKESDLAAAGVAAAQHAEDMDMSLYPYRASMGLRLSDYVAGSSRSSMMSPLPRPVPSSAHGSAVEGRPAPRISPAHEREDEDEEEDGNESATKAMAANVCAEEQNDGVKGVLPAHEASAPRSPLSSAEAMDSNDTTRDTKQTILAGQAMPQDQPNRTIGSAEAEALDGAAVSDSMADESTAPSTAARRTSTTTMTAISSLWLVSGSTPTPLRRLRGDPEESAEAEAPSAEGPRAASCITETRVDAAQEAAKTISVALSSATPPRPSPSHSAKSVVDEDTEAMCARRPLPALVVGGEEELEAAESCSPEPQRPEAAEAEALPLTASISPIPSRDFQTRPRDRLDQHDKFAAAHPSTQSATDVPAYTPIPGEAHPVETRTEWGYLHKAPAYTSTALTRTPPPAHRNLGRFTDLHADSSTATPDAKTGGTTPVPASPSSALSESARVSEEVRELVERAQAEVRRTRASLLATLRDHHGDVPPSDSTVATPRRALVLPDATTHTAEDSPSPETRSVPASSISKGNGRSSGEIRAAAVALRRQLAESADGILRRLQGYDARDHGVLPMETVIRVTYFVVTRRRMPAATWTLRTAEGGIASTPMRASMAKREDDGHHHAVTVGVGAAVGVTSETPASVAYATPRAQRLSHPDTHIGVEGSASTVMVSSAKRARWEGEGAMQNCSPAVIVPHATQGRPATYASPSRTLEQAMSHQARRAEEEEYLNFYFTVLEAFKQVFGERYAWRHLGATNASRHDSAIVKRPRTEGVEDTYSPSAGGGGIGAKNTADADAQLGIVNELNNVPEPLETVFPRLRQQYALRHSDDDSAVSSSAGFARRPPPLDVLVRYRTFIDSLREL